MLSNPLFKLQSIFNKISILTKSKFVTRDIDLFKQFENIEVGISISNMDENLSRRMEPVASNPIERIYKFIEETHPEHLGYYKELRKNPSLWDEIEDEIIEYCELNKLKYRVAFHHGGFSKKKKVGDISS